MAINSQPDAGDGDDKTPPIPKGVLIVAAINVLVMIVVATRVLGRKPGGTSARDASQPADTAAGS